MIKYMSKFSGAFRLLLIILLAMVIGSAFILYIGENPFRVYVVLLQSSFMSQLTFGTMLSNFTPLLLTSMAFAIAAKAGAFNVGVEGAVFLSAIAAAWVGIYINGLPPFPHILLCFLTAVTVGALWSLIPALLKAYFDVSEICVTILMNYVALYITSYLVSGPMSAGVAVPQSLHVQVRLFRFMRPSNVSIGLFIAIVLTIFLVWLMRYSAFGYQMRAVGDNKLFAEYAGINPKNVLLKGMMLSGAIGGVAGCIEVLGTHGVFLNNFAVGLGTTGMLASLIVKNNLYTVPLMALFIAMLKSGALVMQQSAGVPRAAVDAIIAIFIIVASMELLFSFAKKMRGKGRAVNSANPPDSPEAVWEVTERGDA